MNDRLVEVAASALVDSCIAKNHWEHCSEESKECYRIHARAVIAAIEAAQAQPSTPVPWRVFLDDDYKPPRVSLSIGNQTFEIHIDYDDEPGRIEWYLKMLSAAMGSLTVAQPKSFADLYKNNKQGIEIERLKMRIEELEAQQVGVPAGYIGVSSEADFDKYTWTFEMEGDYRVSAGRYLITRLGAAPSLPVDEKVQPLQEWHQHQCATNYFSHAKCDCSVSATAAKVELPVVAYLHFHKTDLMYSKSGQLSFTKFRDDQEPLVRLTDALAAIAAAQGEKP